ncbi:hypothetical protein ACFVSW_12070 [Neobacillus sp. NPDC058068]
MMKSGAAFHQYQKPRLVYPFSNSPLRHNTAVTLCESRITPTGCCVILPT